jgi:hypothetical protein
VNLTVSTTDTTPGEKQSVKEEIDLMLTAVFDEALRRQKRKKKKVCKLPVDLSGKHGEFPQPANESTTIESRMADCKSYAQLLNEYAHVETEQRARLISKSVHEQRADNVLSNMAQFLAREDQQLLFEFVPISDNSPTVKRIELDNNRQKKIKRGKTKVDLSPTSPTKVVTELHAFGAARKIAEGDGSLKAVMKAVRNIRTGRNISEGFISGVGSLAGNIIKAAGHGIIKSAARNAGINPGTLSSIARKSIKAFRATKKKTPTKKQPTNAPTKKYAAKLLQKHAPMKRTDRPVFQRPASGHLRYADSPALAAWRQRWQ